MNDSQIAQSAIVRHRALMNEGRMHETNQQISDRYFGVFCLGDSSEFHTYNAEEIRDGNLQAYRYYQEEMHKTPNWAYTDLAFGMRGPSECVISSHINFTLDNVAIHHVFRT